MFKEIYTSDISIAGIQDKYIDLCIIILQTFTIKQLYTLGMVNEFYQHSNLDSLVGFGFCDIYAVINNTKGLKRLIQVAQKKKYALDDEYEGYLEISTKDFTELSNQVDFALDGEDNSYFWRNMLKGEQSTYGELLFKYASVIRANLVDAVASKIDKMIDYETVRNAYMKEIKEALDNGYAVVPAKVFDDIKLVSLSDLYRIYKIL